MVNMCLFCRFLFVDVVVLTAAAVVINPPPAGGLETGLKSCGVNRLWDDSG